MTREEQMARAGDYVLGLMDEADRERAERDLAIDAEFRDCVTLLAVRMQALDDTAGIADVPADMWRAIEARIADMPQMREAMPEAATPAAGATVPPARRRGTRTPHTARRWGGGLALAAGLLIACATGFLAGRITVTPAESVVVVLLNDENEVPGAFVEAYADDRIRIIPLRDFEVPQGKTLEVWTLYDQEVGPVSLGTFEQPRDITLRGPDLPRPQPNQLYEITLEDAPGSPIGRPTGPILVKGLALQP